MQVWKNGEIVSFEQYNDLEWGYVKGYNPVNDTYLIGYRGKVEPVKADYIMAPYPAPSKVVLKPFHMDEWEMRIDAELMSRVK